MKPYRQWVDPIQIFIDRQVAMPWREHQLFKDVIRYTGRSWAWCPRGRAPLYINEKFVIVNTIEDELIYALDKKYHGLRTRLDAEVELAMLGHNFNEIADMLGIDRWTVHNDLRMWGEREDAEEIKDKIREVASSFDTKGHS